MWHGMTSMAFRPCSCRRGSTSCPSGAICSSVSGGTRTPAHVGDHPHGRAPHAAAHREDLVLMERQRELDVDLLPRHGRSRSGCGASDSRAAHLREPRLERLEHELQVLRVEAEGRRAGRGDLDLSIRFGPQSVGLPAWEEMALRALQPKDVVHWAQRWFTRHNATLWLSAPPPAGFQLQDLPAGEPVTRRPSRPVTDGQMFEGVDTRLSSLSVLSDRDHWGLGTVFSIAGDRAQTRLRDS